MEFITGRPWAVAPKQSEGATKDYKFCGFDQSLTLLDYRLLIVPLQLL